jgi:hypothetical protein
LERLAGNDKTDDCGSNLCWIMFWQARDSVNRKFKVLLLDHRARCLSSSVVTYGLSRLINREQTSPNAPATSGMIKALAIAEVIASIAITSAMARAFIIPLVAGALGLVCSLLMSRERLLIVTSPRSKSEVI